MIPPPTIAASNRSTGLTIGSGGVDGMQRRARLARSRLYLVLEARPHGRDPSALLDAALRGGVDVVQLREKDLADDDLVRAADPFRRACEAHRALFVLNDRPELVERAGADGVHVGQEDAPLADARRAAPDAIVGLSATTARELRGDADYFAVGAIFGTPAKPESPPGGLELVRAARDTLRVPWFAIGGIDDTTISDVAGSGAPGVAVVRAVRDAAEPEAAARALRAALPPSHAVVSSPDERVLVPDIDWVPLTWPSGDRAVAPHTHAAHTDVFHVLDGTMEFRLGDTAARVPAGSLVAAPPFVVHGFRNPGDTTAVALNLHAPGVWARGQWHGLPREQHDQFGPDRASPKSRPPVLSAPGDGDRLTKPHRLAVSKLQSEHLDVLEYVVDGDYDGASLHLHLRHTDCFHVLEGELELELDGETVRATPGMSVVVPRGVPHAFTSVGPARFLNVHAPSCGFSEYLRRVDAAEDLDLAAYDQVPLA
jgi:thiamine-phosphate pyrophosphorylase